MNNIVDKIIKPKKMRVKQYAQGYEIEYKNTGYFNKYYHEHKERIICEACNKSIIKRCLIPHSRTKTHIRCLELLGEK